MTPIGWTNPVDVPRSHSCRKPPRRSRSFTDSGRSNECLERARIRASERSCASERRAKSRKIGDMAPQAGLEPATLWLTDYHRTREWVDGGAGSLCFQSFGTWLQSASKCRPARSIARPGPGPFTRASTRAAFATRRATRTGAAQHTCATSPSFLACQPEQLRGRRTPDRPPGDTGECRLCRFCYGRAVPARLVTLRVNHLGLSSR
jgi:hypothetical protein